MTNRSDTSSDAPSDTPSAPEDLNDCRVYVKQHKRGNEVVFGVCDEALLGQILKEGKFRYEVSPFFFGGTLMRLQQIVPLIRECPNLNAVGPHIIHELINHGVIHKEAVMLIDNVPVALKFVF